MSETKPLAVELAWEGGQRFRGRAGSAEILLDGDANVGPNPVQALALAPTVQDEEPVGRLTRQVVHARSVPRLAGAGHLSSPGVAFRIRRGGP